MRGEKSEISNPVVAWASQTGKGLLFFVKKNETSKTHPAGVLALYDAEDLEKQSPHEFSFKLHGHKHQFKAANDAERDGWYLSIEKAIELGKASKESTRASEGYKAEMEKLSKSLGGRYVDFKAVLLSISQTCVVSHHAVLLSMRDVSKNLILTSIFRHTKHNDRSCRSCRHKAQPVPAKEVH